MTTYVTAGIGANPENPDALGIDVPPALLARAHAVI